MLLELALGISVLLLIVAGIVEFAMRMKERQVFAEFSRQFSRALELTFMSLTRTQSPPDMPWCCDDAGLDLHYSFGDIIDTLLGTGQGQSSRPNLLETFGFRSEQVTIHSGLSEFGLPLLNPNGILIESDVCDSGAETLTRQNHPYRLFRYRLQVSSSACLFCKLLSTLEPSPLEIVGQVAVQCSALRVTPPENGSGSTPQGAGSASSEGGTG